MTIQHFPAVLFMFQYFDIRNFQFSEIGLSEVKGFMTEINEGMTTYQCKYIDEKMEYFTCGRN